MYKLEYEKKMIMKTKYTIRDWLYYYRNTHGINTLPAKLGEKYPCLKEYKKYHSEFTDDEHQEKWLQEGKYNNIIGVLGKISNNIGEIDIDVPDIQLEDIFSDVEEAKKKLWIAESSMGKKKIYFKDDKLGKLKDETVSNNRYTQLDGKLKYPHVEYRTDGFVTVLPPSIHKDSRQPYQWLNLDENNKLPELQGIESKKLYEKIVGKLRTKFDYKEPEKIKKSNIVKKRRGRPRPCFVCGHDNGDAWENGAGHQFRVACVAELIVKNYTDEQIHEFFETHDNNSGETYDYEKTQKQIDFARDTGQHPWKCETIQEKCKGIVAQYCIDCNKSKGEKKDDTLYVCSYDIGDNKYLEEIYREGKEQFVLYDKATDSWKYINEYEQNGFVIKPIHIDSGNSLILPDDLEEYDSLSELKADMLEFALEEYDPVDNKDIFKLICNIFLTSWISPEWQKNLPEKFIPIINPRGGSETGKKRVLTIARWLTYHSIYGLKTNRVPTLFRAISKWKGTLILDEADMKDSAMDNELVEYLNSRADGVSIVRYSTDKKDVEWFYSFGLTVMATRKGFVDDGLESRCTVMPTMATEEPEEYNLIPPKKWLEKGKRLQRKLLLFKLRHMDGEMPNQLTIPKIKSFRVRESLLILEGLKKEDPSIMKDIPLLAKKMEERIIKERAGCPEGLILNSIYHFLTDPKTSLEAHGLGYVAIKKIEKRENGNEPIQEKKPLTLKKIALSLGNTFSSSSIARYWRGFNQDILQQKRVDSKRHTGLILLKKLHRLDKIFPKYIPDYDTPTIMENEMKAKQDKLTVEDEEK